MIAEPKITGMHQNVFRRPLIKEHRSFAPNSVSKKNPERMEAEKSIIESLLIWYGIIITDDVNLCNQLHMK